MRRFIKLLPFDPEELEFEGETMDGVIPKTMTIGEEVACDDRERSLRRLCLTAVSKGGYQVDEEGDSVGKSRT